jgi:hypothetical protein
METGKSKIEDGNARLETRGKASSFQLVIPGFWPPTLLAVDA